MLIIVEAQDRIEMSTKDQIMWRGADRPCVIIWYHRHNYCLNGSN